MADFASVWSRWAKKAQTQVIAAGHFLPEENPQATLDHMLPFLAGTIEK